MEKHIVNFGILGVLLAFVFSFTGCISDGDETISLEFANVKKMIVGEWVLESASGTPRVLTFTDDGYYTDSSDGGTKKHTWRLASDANDGSPYYGGIYLDGVYYEIISLGDGHWRLKDKNGKIFDFGRNGGTNDSDDDNGNASDNSKNTRLKAITHGYGNTQESGTLTYDDTGRLIRFAWEGYTVNYSYEGTNEIKATYSSNNETIIHTISSGKMVKKVVKYGSTNAFAYNYTYKNNRWSNIKMEDYVENGHYDFDYVWNGNNLKELSVLRNGNLDEKLVWKYNNIKTHPLVHALFGFYAYWEGDLPWLYEISEVLPIYSYLGTLPVNLFSEVTYTDYLEKNPKPYTSSLSYSMDSNGNVTKIMVNDKESYTLTWEKFK